MCISIYIYIYLYTYVICVYISLSLSFYIYMHMYMYMHMYFYTCVYTHISIPIFLHSDNTSFGLLMKNCILFAFGCAARVYCMLLCAVLFPFILW